MKQVILIAMFLALGACATGQTRTAYTLSPSGDLVQTQVPSESDNRLLETVAIVGLGIVGLYFVGEIFDVWEDDDKPAPVVQPTNGLVPTGGQTSWSVDLIQPVYQEVN